MKTYSMDLRERVVAAVDRKEGTWDAIAARFRVSRAWIGKLLGQRRRNGSIAPRPRHTGRPPALDANGLDRLRAAIDADPDATPEELRRAARVTCSPSTVRRALGRMGYTRKKSRSAPPSRTGPRSPRPARRGVGLGAAPRGGSRIDGGRV
jgi:transposase